MSIVSIIILTYNSEKYIKPLLESLIDKYSDEIEGGKLEIIVADNKSSDDTAGRVSSIRNKISSIKWIENGGNYGYAKGNNLAAEKAQGEYLVFINPDTIFFNGDIFELIKLLDNERVGVVGGKVLTWDEKVEKSSGKFYNAQNTFLLALGLEEAFGVRFSPEKEKDVDFVSGAFFAVRRSLFEKLGGFDENYFMYIEDSDFCFRAKKLGFKVVFSPIAVIKHLGQGSSNRKFAVVNIYKGLLYFNKERIGLLSYKFVFLVLWLKAGTLVLIGKIINNKYLSSTYLEALEVLKN